MIEIEPSRYETQPKVPSERKSDKPSVLPVGRMKRWSKRRHLDWVLQKLRFRFPLLATDLVASLTILVLVACSLEMVGLHMAALRQLSLFAIQGFVLVLTYEAFKLYRSVGMHPVVELERVVTATAIAFLTLLAITVWRSDRDVGHEVLFLMIAGIFCCVGLPSIRHLMRCQLGKTRWWRQPLIVIGGSSEVDELINRIDRERHLGWAPIGFIEEFQQNWERSSDSKHCLGDEEDLPGIIERERVFWGLIDSSSMPNSQTQIFLDRYHHLLPNLVCVVGGEGRTSFLLDIDCAGAAGICLSVFHFAAVAAFHQAVDRSLDIGIRDRLAESAVFVDRNRRPMQQSRSHSL